MVSQHWAGRSPSLGIEAVGTGRTADLPKSILAVDIGSAWTKAVLVDRVEGEYRLIARATAPTGSDDPIFGAASGVLEAAARIERATGRRLLVDYRLAIPVQADGRGVDALAAATSAAPYLPIVVLAICEDLSLAAAVTAARSTYCDVKAAVSADGGLGAGQWRRWSGLGGGGLQAVGDELLRLDPEVVLLTGGHDGGAVGPLRKLASAVASAASDRRRLVLYAGNAAALDAVGAELAGAADLVAVDNVSPRSQDTATEPAGLELHRLFRERKVPELPGYEWIRALTAWDLETTADGFWASLRFLAQQESASVLGIDVGASSTVWGFADGEALARQVRTRCGTAGGSVDLLAEVGAERVTRWLPYGANEGAVLAVASRRERAPSSVPETPEETWLERALCREAMRAMGGPVRAGIVVGAGGSVARARPAEAALSLLDGLQPVGICRLALDSAGLTGCMSALGRLQPEAAASVLLGDGLVHLGTAVCPASSGAAKHKAGQPALRVRVRLGERNLFDEEIAFGTIRRVAVPPGFNLRVEARPARGLDLGLGAGAPVLLEVEGAGLGFILDCRGRPFDPPGEAQARISALRTWYSALD